MQRQHSAQIGTAQVGAAEPDAREDRIAVVVPCFRAANTVGNVIARIGPEVQRIYVIDDGCPIGSGRVAEGLSNPRVRVLRNERNLGVGGAVKLGYTHALADGMDVIVKIDADGQMNPSLLPLLIAPLLDREADYAKGNRFAAMHLMPVCSAAGGAAMPTVRRISNNIASFAHKAVTGYWSIVDPANGFTAVHRAALEAIDFEAVADCYFFETDMLFQLNLRNAVVADVPLPAVYGTEVSSLRIGRLVVGFPRFAVRRFLKRIWLKYLVEDFNLASLHIAVGVPIFLFGVAVGLYHWLEALESGVPATAGTVMFAALPVILGFQLLLSALGYDVARRYEVPLSRRAGPPG